MREEGRIIKSERGWEGWGESELGSYLDPWKTENCIDPDPDSAV